MDSVTIERVRCGALSPGQATAAAEAFAAPMTVLPTRGVVAVAGDDRIGNHRTKLVAPGVRPEARRAGIGRRLLTPVLERADDDRVACHLETSDRCNVGFYERLGFTIVDDDLMLVNGGPSHVSMRKEPRR